MISDLDFSFKEEVPTTDNNGFLPPVSSMLRHETSKFRVHVLVRVLLTNWVSGFVILLK